MGVELPKGRSTRVDLVAWPEGGLFAQVVSSTVSPPIRRREAGTSPSRRCHIEIDELGPDRGPIPGTGCPLSDPPTRPMRTNVPFVGNRRPGGTGHGHPLRWRRTALLLLDKGNRTREIDSHDSF